MSNKIYLGIDESNRGRDPEIFVAVNSAYESDIIKSQDKIPKRRKDKGSIKDLLKAREFKYTLVPRHYDIVLSGKKKELSDYNKRLLVCSELITSFSNLKLVIGDGSVRQDAKGKLEKILGLDNMPNIIFEDNADNTYLIVNMADQIANKLYKAYNKNKRMPKKYDENMVPFDINKYVCLAEMIVE